MEVIQIKPIIKNKPKLEELLTDQQIDYIQKVLEKSCEGNICVSKSRLFEELQKPLSLTIEQYQFEQAVATLIKLKKISGFRTRPGRNGGICRITAFKGK